MSRKKTTEEVIKEFKKIHGDKYDYSKVNYFGTSKKVEIICSKHGSFLMQPNNHKNGQKCPKCSGKINYTTDSIITEFKKIHGNRYNYSKVNYKNNSTHIIIICSVHGEFTQTPAKHKLGRGCSRCAGRQLTKDDVLKQFKIVHGDKYDYSKVNYVNEKTKVEIICSNHGSFFMIPNSHKNGSGCQKCGGKNIYDSNSIIKKFKSIHGEKYDYSKVEYVNTSKKIKITCPHHDDFWMTPSNHLKGQQCPKCAGVKTYNTNSIIKKFKSIHGDKYDYSKVEYVNTHSKVEIICSSHGPFFKSPSHHFKQGCPMCSNILKGKMPKFYFESLVEEFKIIHNNKYDYSRAKYINYHSKIEIVCPKHGSYWQSPSNHRKGRQCNKCVGGTAFSQNDIIKKFKEIHGDKYDYSKVNYQNVMQHVEIVCLTHGKFNQQPRHHIAGHGCPYCTLTPQSKQELTITHELMTVFNNINPRGFKTKLKGKIRSIDIFIPELNLGIEFDGSHWHKDKRALDKLKTEQLEELGFNIIRVRQKPLKRIFEDDVMAEKKFDGKQITNDVLKQIMKDFDLDKSKIKKIKEYINKPNLQNEEGLDDYIDMIMEEKANK